MNSCAIWCNRHLQIFQILQIALALRARSIMFSLKQVTLAYEHQIVREIIVTFTS